MSTRKPIFFMVAVMAIYQRDEDIRQRHMNVLLEAATPNLTKAHLSQVQKSAMARLHAENNVPPGDVKDVVILSISVLGQMTQEQFEAEPEKDPVQ